jgi:hypothetical protein
VPGGAAPDPVGIQQVPGRIEPPHEVIAGAAVVLEEVVALDVVHDVTVPAASLIPVEVPADDQAATPVQQCLRFGGNSAGLDVRVVDDRPDRVATVPGRDDLVDLRRHLLLNDGEDFFDRAARGGDTGPQSGLDLRDGGGDIRWCLLPVRYRGQRGGVRLCHGKSLSRNGSLLRTTIRGSNFPGKVPY